MVNAGSIAPAYSGVVRRTGQVGHVVDPLACSERRVRVRVVRLPQRLRVGRQREAADGDVVSRPPRARARGRRRRSQRAAPSTARRLPDEEAGDDERQEQQACVRRGSRARGRRPRPSRRAAAAVLRSLRGEQGQVDDRRGEQLVDDLPVDVDVVPDEVRVERRDRRLRSVPRAATGSGARSRRRSAPLPRRPRSGSDRRPASSVRRSSRSGSGRTRTAGCVHAEGSPGMNPNVPRVDEGAREVVALLGEVGEDRRRARGASTASRGRTHAARTTRVGRATGHSDARLRLRQARRLDPRPLPELEHDQAPQAVAVVGPAGDVLVEQPLHRLRRGTGRAAVAVGREEISGEVAQLSAEPGRQRHAEALLPTLRPLRAGAELQTPDEAPPSRAGPRP